MAKLPPDIRATLTNQKEQMLDIIDEACIAGVYHLEEVIIKLQQEKLNQRKQQLELNRSRREKD